MSLHDIIGVSMIAFIINYFSMPQGCRRRKRHRASPSNATRVLDVVGHIAISTRLIKMGELFFYFLFVSAAPIYQPCLASLRTTFVASIYYLIADELRTQLRIRGAILFA